MEFLRRVVSDLNGRGIDLKRTAVVTPSRRAGLFLKKYLYDREGASNPVWLPDRFSIQDFVAAVSRITLLDHLSLVFKLYPVYRAVFNSPRPFDAYYQWGSIVISDFNEIDLCLCDRGTLFEKLQNLSRIGTESAGNTPMVNEFIRFAGALKDLYFSFTSRLLETREGYYGLALREIPGDFDADRFSRWDTIVFAGFNALTAGEQTLIAGLEEAGKALVYWDIDAWFYDNDAQEAGRFFRKNPRIDRSTASWIDDDLRTLPKTISITGTAGRAGMAKVLGSLLAEEEQFAQDDTAVILPDETLLFPVLHSLPDRISRINVTMGYPLKYTALYNLVEAVFDMHIDAGGGSEGAFRYASVAAVLRHPYIYPMAEEAVEEILALSRDQQLAFLQQDLLQPLNRLIPGLFEPVSATGDMVALISNLLRQIASWIEAGDPEQHLFEIEYLFQFMTRLQRIAGFLEDYEVHTDIPTFRRLFRDVIQSTSVPFIGEPLHGLQIMGLLETRSLDFKHVIILSVNEGILPAAQAGETYIPNDVREDAGMPTSLHQDAVYAYYFYRLLKRAEKVTILYNTVHDSFGKGEKSRFIEQILHELASAGPAVTVRETIASIEPVFDAAAEIVIPKSEEIMALLASRHYSPTSLQTYLNCSLRFYFTYILGLAREDDVLETADASVFGTILHEVLNRLYRPLLKKPLTTEHISDMKERATGLVSEIYREKMGTADLARGKNYLYREIIETLVLEYLEGERPGLTVLSTEERFSAVYESASGPISLLGYIDRIQTDGTAADLIDFKTGTVSSLAISSFADLSSDQLREKLREKSGVLQLLIYCLLTCRSGRVDSRLDLRPCLYSFRTQREGKGARFLDLGDGAARLRPKAAAAAAGRVLDAVCEPLFDPDDPFRQTADRPVCAYCPFVTVCGRQ
ncbi:PD-(D/E)XK nuclease family protein [bacterium]|nr:PD-(D/E)XK nuclease family protein [bacterium]